MKQFLMAMVAMTFVPAMALSQDKTDQMKITVHASDTALSATLDDTAAAQDFASMLPLTLTLEDYHGIEKVAIWAASWMHRTVRTAMRPRLAISLSTPHGKTSRFLSLRFKRRAG